MVVETVSEGGAIVYDGDDDGAADLIARPSCRVGAIAAHSIF